MALSLFDAPAVQSARPLEGLQSLLELSLTNCPRLEYLVLWGCDAFPEALRRVHQTPAELEAVRTELDRLVTSARTS